MKKLLLIILVFICFPCSILFSETSEDKTRINIEDFLSKYRNYPFQWIFPEYNYKAEVICIEKEKKHPMGYTRAEFFGLSACIPSQYTHKIERKHDIIHFRSKTGDRIMMIKSKDSSMLCSEYNQYHTKDFCSAYKTVQEYYHKLFTLTPDTVQSTGDKWIVHGKGIAFENVKKIEIYSNDMFMAYVKVIKNSLVHDTKFSHEIVLFHKNGPLNAFITINFISKNDTLLKHFISTIE